MQTTHASSRSASSPPAASSRRWTVRSTIRESSRGARLAAVVAAGLAVVCAFHPHIPATTAVVLVGLIPAALVDVIDRRLPNRLVGGAAALGLLAVGIEALATDLEVAPADLLLGATLMAGLPFAIHMAVPAAMGFGDVKVALLTGAALGLADWLLGLAALAIGSAGAALIAIARRRRTVPFGPGLVGGAIVALALLASPLDPIGRTGDEPSGSPLTTVREVRA